MRSTSTTRSPKAGEQIAVVRELRRLVAHSDGRGRFFAVPNGGSRQRGERARLAAQGVVPGAPDLLIVGPPSQEAPGADPLTRDEIEVLRRGLARLPAAAVAGDRGRGLSAPRGSDRDEAVRRESVRRQRGAVGLARMVPTAGVGGGGGSRRRGRAAAACGARVSYPRSEVWPGQVGRALRSITPVPPVVPE
jgi:hypothetical protein